MTEIRKIRKVGGSLTLTIPIEIGFKVGDWIKFEKSNNQTILTKLVIE